MALTFYGFSVSQPARALEWLMRMEKTKFEKVSVLPGKGTRTDEFKKQGQFLTVPRIDDNGFILNESHAIMAYLGEKHNWSTYPKDLKVRAKMNEYFNWHHANTRSITNAWFAPGIRPDLVPSKEFAKLQEQRAKQALKHLDRTLATSKWLAGDVVTCADISAFCEISQCLPEFFNLHDLNQYPNVMNWVNNCKKLPCYEEAHAGFFKMLPKLLPMLEKNSKL
eukprot:TRINITY_DN145_c3_g3_i1.p1 TRINITY_DN145_c3_g3~~TRINITY_DN145_c3_g3_i1.p1  ORF type:complete len:239 (+),score=40.80 TRINITY_DN145_c3_g3_i1:50-718(+)